MQLVERGQLHRDDAAADYLPEHTTLLRPQRYPAVTIRHLLSHSSGVVEMYYGRALTQASWELATDVVIRSQSGALYGGAKRLYGIVEGGDLAYVEERIMSDGGLEPRLSARLTRYIG